MSFVDLSINNDIAVIKLNRGKVHALNETLVEELSANFNDMKYDNTVKSIILTGTGKFFSFGLDIPELMPYSRESFEDFIIKFCNLYSQIYMFPKPVICAVNGHAIAGGFILASCCDYRLMVTGKARITLNEITFGSSLFAGNLEILKALVGIHNAELIALRGKMYSAEQAREMNLVDRLVSENDLMAEAVYMADSYAQKDKTAFNSIKKLIRQPVYEAYKTREELAIREFVKIWYSEYTRSQIAEIKIKA